MRGTRPRYSLPAALRAILRSILVKGYEQTILAAFAADGRQLEAPHAAHCENICSVGGLVGGLQRQVVDLHTARGDIFFGTGPAAGDRAGALNAIGRLTVLLPKGGLP